MKRYLFRLMAIALIALAISKLRALFSHTAIDYGPTFIVGHVIEAASVVLLGTGLWLGVGWWTKAYLALSVVTTLDGFAMVLMARSEPQMMGGLGKSLIGLALLLGGLVARSVIGIRRQQADGLDV